MNTQSNPGRPRLRAAALAWLAVLTVAACAMDRGTETTRDDGYTVALKAVDGAVNVGDQTPLLVTVRRVDNGALGQGMAGVITITTSIHGQVDASTVAIRVQDDSTRESLTHLVFKAKYAGVAEVRATFLDATATVQILVSDTVN